MAMRVQVHLCGGFQESVREMGARGPAPSAFSVADSRKVFRIMVRYTQHKHRDRVE